MSLFINISNVLAVFDISKDVDADGKQVEPPQLWTTSVTSYVISLRLVVRGVVSDVLPV